MPSGRGWGFSVFGLLNIDKPGGITSRDVVDRVARLVKPDKVGHAGTLDPLATGVLVVCIGRATRLVPYIQEQTKIYRAVFRLGWTSDTDDVDGEARELADAPPVTRAALEAKLPEFTGSIEQVPPRFSAVKVKGRRAYDLARRGERPELAPRTVQVHGMRIVGLEYPELTLEIECGSGTYVRAIGRDLARAVGSAAVMTELRRLAVGVFREETAIRADGLSHAVVRRELLPPALALAGRVCCTLSDAELQRLKQGRDVPWGGVSIRSGDPAAGFSHRPGDPEADPLVAVFDGNGGLIAVGERQQTRLVPRQVFA